MRISETFPPFALLLRQERLARAWSQARLAQELGNIDSKTISRWERGINKPTTVLRERLCSLFGKSASQLGLLEQDELSIDPTPFPLFLCDPAIPPLPPTRLIGREQALGSLKVRLLNGGNVTALNGLPGIGKTALASVLAHDQEVRARFSDGILWVGLGPAPNLPSLWSRWGALLDMTPPQIAMLNQEDWPAALHSAIGSRHLLLVIDDVWRLEDALNVRIGGDNCAYLMTTRFPTIAAHMTPEGTLPLPELNEEESIALLRRLAPQVVDCEGQRVRALVRAAGGLPLALVLLGTHLREHAYVGPTRRIIAAFEQLSHASVRLQISEPHGPIERYPSLSAQTQLSLQSVISISDQHLSAEARAALCALSVFPAKPTTFSEEAALAVAACTVDTLDTLTDAGLLESTSADRYTLHQVIADYARLRLQQTPASLRGASLRLVDYALTFVEAHQNHYEQLERESALLQAAFSIAQEFEQKAAFVQGVHAYVPFLLARGLYLQAEAYLVRASGKIPEVIGDQQSIHPSTEI